MTSKRQVSESGYVSVYSVLASSDFKGDGGLKTTSEGKKGGGPPPFNPLAKTLRVYQPT